MLRWYCLSLSLLFQRTWRGKSLQGWHHWNSSAASGRLVSRTKGHDWHCFQWQRRSLPNGISTTRHELKDGYQWNWRSRLFVFCEKRGSWLVRKSQPFARPGLFLGSGSVRLYSQNYKLKRRRWNFLKLIWYDGTFRPYSFTADTELKQRIQFVPIDASDMERPEEWENLLRSKILCVAQSTCTVNVATAINCIYICD